MGKLDKAREVINEVTGTDPKVRGASFPPIPGFNPHEYGEEELKEELGKHEAFLSFAALAAATSNGEWIKVDKTFLKAMFMGVVQVDLEFFEEDNGLQFRVRANLREKYSIADMMMGGEGGKPRPKRKVVPSHAEAMEEMMKRDYESYLRERRDEEERFKAWVADNL